MSPKSLIVGSINQPLFGKMSPLSSETGPGRRRKSSLRLSLQAFFRAWNHFLCVRLDPVAYVYFFRPQLSVGTNPVFDTSCMIPALAQLPMHSQNFFRAQLLCRLPCVALVACCQRCFQVACFPTLNKKTWVRFFTKIQKRIIDPNDPRRRCILWIISKYGYFGYMIRRVSSYYGSEKSEFCQQ